MTSPRSLVLTAAFTCFPLLSLADTIAFWNQNSNNLPGGGFGFTASSFPQAASVGSGSLTLRDFNATTNPDGSYANIASFGGTTDNDIAVPPTAGGSISPVGTVNNGMSIVLQISTSGFEDIAVSWAQRGTSTGFTSRVFSYSTDGVNFTTFATNSGALSSTWSVENYDLSAVAAIENSPTVFLRITLSGASSGSGNNRFDNIHIQGSPAGPDTNPPVVATLSPADDATNVPLAATPSIVFDEGIQKGTGDLLIRRSADDTIFETIPVSSTQVAVSDSTLTITPATALDASTGYYLEIPPGAVEDLAGNDFAGLTGNAAWNFTTIASAALPTVTKTFDSQTRVRTTGASTTADYYGQGTGQGTFAVHTFGTFNFSKLDFALPGSSTITGIDTAEFTLTHNDRTFSQGTELEFFLTTDAPAGKTFDAAIVNGINPAQYDFAPVSLGRFPYSPQAGGVKDTFTLDLSAVEPVLVSRLNTGENFSIILAAVNAMDAITYSGKGNTFDPGDPELKLTIEETTGVDTTPPSIAFLIPADGATSVPVSSNLRLSFNEIIQKGTGTISIYRAGDNALAEAIDVGGSQVSVNLGTVIVDPSVTLASGSNYYVHVSSGAIQDTSGNAFAGIADATTWNFSTAQPPLTNLGPFAVSENAHPGTVVGDLNPAVVGGEGIRYATLGGEAARSMMNAVPGTGYLVTPIFTIGDTFEGATGALNPTTAGSYTPPGIPDGIGAYELDADTIRIFVNHELQTEPAQNAYPYQLANGTNITGGARISYFDIDKASRRVTDTGLAIGNMIDRAGNPVTSASQLDLGALDRFCSGSLFEPDLFGAGRGLVDRIYLCGEETSTGFGHPHGGTYWILDPATGNFWAAPDMGRGSWENAALVDTGTTTHVAFLLGDDFQSAPLYLYVGQKNNAPGANFLQRNGLAGGQLYVWKATNGDLSPTQFNGTGSTRNGTWVPLDARVPANAGAADHDALGYRDDDLMRSLADGLGAFSFARPEDISTSPTDGSIACFTSTGRGSVFPADNWGTVYVIDLDFANLGTPAPMTASISILYDCDDIGGGQFDFIEDGLRCPDNLDWADDGFIYVQEDRANSTGDFGASGEEVSLWRLDSTTGAAVRVAQIDRSNPLPLGSSDTEPGDFANWESSGVVDVSTLFDEAPGTLFLFDVQAHSVTNGLIQTKDLGEGGQICFLHKGRTRPAFALNPNTGVITVNEPDALDAARHPLQELRIQSFDGTNSEVRSVQVNVNSNPVATDNRFTFAAYNASLHRNSAGALVSDLSNLQAADPKSIARIIQHNAPDVILVNEFDYDEAGRAARLFKENYLEVGQTGESPIYYPYMYVAPSNTGIPSGFDLDNNGTVDTTTGDATYAQDAFGFAEFPGRYAFVVFSKFPIDEPNVRTFQYFLWKDMPGALLPDDPDLPGTGDWFSPAELNVFRLSSKNHADIPVLINGTPVHILASHPTPPVFDDPASGAPWKAGVDHNGRRNSDEIRFWTDYVNPANSGYIYDDGEWLAAGSTTPANPSGGLPADTRFIIAGDLNADFDEGDSTPPAALNLSNSSLVNTAFVPAGGAGPDPDDTAAFSGGVRVDYALPSNFGLDVNDGQVFWPATGPLVGALDASDHHLVFMDLTLTGVSLPPLVDLATYYQPAAGLFGSALQNALQGIIDDHTIIEYSDVDAIMPVLDQVEGDPSQIRLLYSLATLPGANYIGNGGPEATSWNREHVWPRNDGVGEDGPDFSDLHHLFPAQVNVNGRRLALPFNEVTNVTDFDPFAPESVSDGDFWEPHDPDKGIVARAMLYMATRYDGSDALTTDLVLNNAPVFGSTDSGVLSTLLAWNRSFPPVDYEKHRNQAIQLGIQVGGQTFAQGNRNPFTDFPQFADAIFLPAGQASFGKWQLQNFTLAELLDPAVSGPDADGDGDGNTNYFEFLTGGSATGPDAAPLTAEQVGGSVVLRFRQPNGFLPEETRLWTSTSLTEASWTEVMNWQASATVTNTGDHQQIEVTLPFAPGETRRFWIVTYE